VVDIICLDPCAAEFRRLAAETPSSDGRRRKAVGAPQQMFDDATAEHFSDFGGGSDETWTYMRFRSRSMFAFP